MEYYIKTIESWVWGPQTIIAMLAVAVWFMFKTRFYTLRQLVPAFVQLYRTRHIADDSSGVNGFKTLMLSLAATIGTGNIAGVALAIQTGGPGAVFWMWVAGFFGMALKMIEAVASVKWRSQDEEGRNFGGPMFYMVKALGHKWTPLAWIYAVALVIAGILTANLIQAHEVYQVVSQTLFSDSDNIYMAKIITSLIMFVLVYVVMVGGFRSVADIASKMVPTMALIYVIAGLIIVFLHLDQVPAMFGSIFYYAFQPSAMFGGAIGVTFVEVMRIGFSRGVFSSESGTGTAGFAHASVSHNDPILQGRIGMLGSFIDTLVVCTVTALVVLLSGQWENSTYISAALTDHAFTTMLPYVGQYIVPITLVVFVYTTIIGWGIYVQRGIEFTLGEWAVQPYRLIWSLLVPVGVFFETKFLWDIGNVAYGILVYPSIITLAFLVPITAKMVRDSEKL